MTEYFNLTYSELTEGLHYSIETENLQSKNDIINLFSSYTTLLDKDLELDFINVVPSEEYELVQLDDFLYWPGVFNTSYMLVSQKARDIMQEFTLGEYKFHPVRVEFKGAFIQYFLFQYLPNSIFKSISFKDSDFALWQWRPKQVIADKRFTVEDYNSYLRISEEVWSPKVSLSLSRIKLTNHLDLMEIPVIGTVFSKQLKSAIVDNGITGIKLTKVEQIIFISG